MTDTTTPAAAAGPHTADRIGHLLIGTGAVLHAIGGKMLRGRNEQLSAELAEAHRRVDELVRDREHAARRAYDVGRAHQAAAAPWSTDVLADVDAHPWTVNADELADVDEHQVHDITGGQNPPLEHAPDQPADVAPNSADRVAEWAGPGYSMTAQTWPTPDDVAAAPISSTSTTAAAAQ